MKKVYDLQCNIAKALNLVGDRWTLLIVNELIKGKKTYKEIKEALAGISTNILADRLKVLEENKLIQTELYSTHPPRYVYSVTEKGRSLQSVLLSISVWSQEHIEKAPEHVVHETCGQAVTHSFYCPHCETATTDVYARTKRELELIK